MKVTVLTEFGSFDIEADSSGMSPGTSGLYGFYNNKTEERERRRLFRSPITETVTTQTWVALVRAKDILSILPASAIEAPSGGETVKQGSTEGDSPAPKGDAQ